MSDQQQWLKEWEGTRKGGKRAFVWRFGVCWWDGMMSLCLCVMILVQDWRDGSWHLLPYTGIPLTLIGGYFVGLMDWKRNEKRYAAMRGTPERP
jgi:hypothetical protein